MQNIREKGIQAPVLGEKLEKEKESFLGKEEPRREPGYCVL